MNYYDNELRYREQRCSGVPCDNVFCRFHDFSYEQNCKASADIGNDIPYIKECDKYFTTFLGNK